MLSKSWRICSSESPRRSSGQVSRTHRKETSFLSWTGGRPTTPISWSLNFPVKKDDIRIELAGRRLVVTGERKEKGRKGIVRRRSRLVGAFHREILLPRDRDDNAVEASLSDGVLSIRVHQGSGRSAAIDYAEIGRGPGAIVPVIPQAESRK
jgi:hypothetical protein